MPGAKCDRTRRVQISNAVNGVRSVRDNVGKVQGEGSEDVRRARSPEIPVAPDLEREWIGPDEFEGEAYERLSCVVVADRQKWLARNHFNLSG